MSTSKNIKSILDEVRPNALWDAIKYIGLGALAVMGLLTTAIVQRLRGIPYDFIGIIIVGVAWVFLISIAYILGRFLNRHRSPGQDRVESNTTQKPAEDLSDEHTKDAQTIEQYRRTVEQLKEDAMKREVILSAYETENRTLKTQYKWLYEIAESEKRNLQNAVLIEDCEIRYQLSDQVPTIEFTFYIFNGSVYTITIDSPIKGEVAWRKRPLSGEAKMLGTPPRNIPQKSREKFTICQWVNPSEADSISTANRPLADYFYFNNLKIGIRGGEDFPDVQPGQLKLPHSIYRYNERDFITNAARQHEETSTLKAERDWLKAQLDERNKHELTFEIDDKQTQVHMDVHKEVRRIQANVKLRCIKVVERPLAVRKFHASLHKQNLEGEETVVPKGDAMVTLDHPNMKDIDLTNGWIVSEPITPYHWFLFYLELSPEVDAHLSKDYFLRISMFEGARQDPFSIDFYVDNWQFARESNSHITLRRR